MGSQVPRVCICGDNQNNYSLFYIYLFINCANFMNGTPNQVVLILFAYVMTVEIAFRM
uniref:Uncharacterized protein n=1 Tax=Arundo donax TaxID=35708 RepID=A0A0A9C629_ARUDO